MIIRPYQKIMCFNIIRLKEHIVGLENREKSVSGVQLF